MSEVRKRIEPAIEPAVIPDATLHLPEASHDVDNPYVRLGRVVDGYVKAVLGMTKPLPQVPASQTHRTANLHVAYSQAAQGDGQPTGEARQAPDRPPISPVEARAAPEGLKVIDGDCGPLKVDTPSIPEEKARNGKGGDGGGTFHKRLGQVDFNASLKAGVDAVRRNLIIVMLFTVASNVLVLAIPIYLFQISDRVLTSRSTDTLIMLTIVIVGAILLQAAFDALRRCILMRTAVEFAAQLARRSSVLRPVRRFRATARNTRRSAISSKSVPSWCRAHCLRFWTRRSHRSSCSRSFSSIRISGSSWWSPRSSC